MIRHKFFLGLKHFIEVQRFVYIKQMLHQQFDGSNTVMLRLVTTLLALISIAIKRSLAFQHGKI